MSYVRARHRSALLAAALVAGAPLLLPAAAHAQPEASGRQVSFTGSGLLGLSCEAVPDTGSVTVAAETTLRVVNRTGHRATLLLDGAPRGEIPSGGAAEVLFHRGPVELGLKPHCMLPEESSIRVQVVPPRPAPSPTSARPPVAPSPSGEGKPTGAGSPSRGATAPIKGDGVLGRAATAPGRAADHHPARERQAEPATGDMARSRPDATPTTAPATAPTTAGLEPTDTVLLPEPRADGDTPELAAEPMASVQPVSEDGPIGLLAVIATVCVLGVSIGAIRAILAERASRASIA